MFYILHQRNLYMDVCDGCSTGLRFSILKMQWDFGGEKTQGTKVTKPWIIYPSCDSEYVTVDVNIVIVAELSKTWNSMI